MVRELTSEKKLKEKFLEDLNQDIGIVHRVCNSFYAIGAAGRDDLFQEIMYQLWRSYPSFNGDSKFSTWMYRVAFNTAITHSKKLNRTPEKTEIKESHHPVTETDKEADEKERLNQLYTAIHSLKEIDRAIILLYLEDQSYTDIADITGLTKTNISVKLVRIKRLLKTKLNNQL